MVEALNTSDSVLAETVSDENGHYSLNLPQNTDVRIRVYAQLLSASPSWDIQVTDNTDGNALYVIQGNLTTSGTTDSTRDLHANSGWGGAGYTSARAAAPFAILDAVYESLEKISQAKPNIVLPPTEIRWSTENRATPGNLAEGDIGNSHFSSADNAIYILGSEDNDTDEYDRHVVSHEFAHYLEFNIFRSDSLGGSHSLTEDLDMRVAFGEGYANAFAAISLTAPVYQDSLGNKQTAGFSFDVSQSSASNPGWFNEASIQTFFYGIYEADPNNFSAIFNTLSSSTYVNADALTGVHLFGSLLKQQNPNLENLIDNLASTHNFSVSDIWGSTEDNDGGISNVLPLYDELSVNGAAVRACSTNTEGEFNKLGNAAFIKVDLPSLDTYTIHAVRTSGLVSSDPDLWFIQEGLLFGIGESSLNNSETLARNYNAGTGVIVVWEASNRDESSGGGNVCFDVSISN